MRQAQLASAPNLTMQDLPKSFFQPKARANKPGWCEIKEGDRKPDKPRKGLAPSPAKRGHGPEPMTSSRGDVNGWKGDPPSSDPQPLAKGGIPHYLWQAEAATASSRRKIFLFDLRSDVGSPPPGMAIQCSGVQLTSGAGALPVCWSAATFNPGQRAKRRK